MDMHPDLSWAYLRVNMHWLQGEENEKKLEYWRTVNCKSTAMYVDAS